MKKAATTRQFSGTLTKPWPSISKTMIWKTSVKPPVDKLRLKIPSLLLDGILNGSWLVLLVLTATPARSDDMHKKLFQKADGEMVTPEEQDAAKQTLTEMQINTSVVPFELNFPPPGFVVAYDSDVSESTLTEWLNANPWLVCVVVINKYALWKIGIGESKMEKMEMVSKDSYKELLFLAAKLNQMALMSSRKLEQWRVHISNATKGTPTVEPALDFAHFGPQSYFEPPDRR